MNFHLNTEKQVFYCHRCKRGGSKFEWVAQERGLIECDEKIPPKLFPEVLRIAAEKAGIPCEMDIENREQLRKYKEERDTLHEIFLCAHQFYQDQLKQKHLDEIAHRWGFSPDTVERFGIGYAPEEGDCLLSHLMLTFSSEDVLKSGLVKRTERGVKDLFQGRIIIPYILHGEPVHFIGRQTPWTPKWDEPKYKKQLRHSEKHPYVSRLVNEPIFGVDSLGCSKYVVLTEGITDCISAIENGFPSLSPVTTRFKKEHISQLARWTANRIVYIANDNDEANGTRPGLEGALCTLKALHENSFLVILPKDDDIEKVDLNDFFRNHEPHDFEKLLKTALPRDDALYFYRGDLVALFRSVLREHSINPQQVRKEWHNQEQGHSFFGIEHILKGIRDIKHALAIFRRSEKEDPRSPTCIEKDLRKRIISRVVRKDLQKRGRFLKDDYGEAYYFFDEEKRVVKISGMKKMSGNSEMEPLLSELYDLNAETAEGRFALKELENFSLRTGQRIEVHRITFYDKKRNRLHVFDRGSQYFVVDGTRIRKKPNGTNEIYFKSRFSTSSSSSSSLTYIPPDERSKDVIVPGELTMWKREGSLLHRFLCNRTNFSYETALDEGKQRLQLLLHFYAILFNELFHTRPILCFVGQKGSGKSATLRMIGKFFCGHDFDLRGVPTEKDFSVLAANNSLLFLDNVDRPYKWLEDALATVATGITYSKRKLFTDFTEISKKPQCFIGITSRDPHFKRDDVADRMLLHHVKKFKLYLKEDALYQPMETHASLLWSLCLDDANRIIKLLNEIKLEEISSPHRLADWAAFALVTAQALGIEIEKVKTLLTNMEMERAAFSLLDDPLREALKSWVKSSKNQGEWYSTGELYTMLVEEHSEFKKTYESVQSLGKRLANVETELRCLFKMERRKNHRTNAWEVRFPTKKQWFGDTEEDGNSEHDSQNDQTELYFSSGDVEVMAEHEEKREPYSQEELITIILTEVQKQAERNDSKWAYADDLEDVLTEKYNISSREYLTTVDNLTGRGQLLYHKGKNAYRIP